MPSNYPNSSWLIVNCRKQVSNAKNVRNCHKQASNNEIVWICVSNILQYIISVNKMLKINLFFYFHQVIILYQHQCMSFWLITYHFSNYFIIFMSHNHHHLKHSETAWNWWYQCRRSNGIPEQEYPPSLSLGTTDPATVRRESDPRIIGDHPGAGVPTTAAPGYHWPYHGVEGEWPQDHWWPSRSRSTHHHCPWVPLTLPRCGGRVTPGSLVTIQE